MKTWRLAPTMLMILIVTVNAQQPDNIREIIKSIHKAIDEHQITDPRYMPASMAFLPEYKKLVSQIDNTWAMSLNNLQSIAPDSLSQFILFDALQELPPEEYLQVLDKAVDLRNSGVISDSVLMNEIIFTSGDKWGFLATNYKDPRVIQLLQKLKQAVAKDPSAVKSVDDLLSGSDKIAVENNIRYNPDYQGRSVKKLSPAPGTSTPTITQTTSTKTMPIAALPTSSQPATPQTTAAMQQAPSHFPLVWIIVGAIVLIIGGLFAWKKLF